MSSIFRQAEQLPGSNIDERLRSYSRAADAADVSAIAMFLPDSGKQAVSHGRAIRPISLVALAAGLGVMAYPVPAEGKVVVTKTNIPNQHHK